MTTIIRIKRHREDDPVEAVLLECKRRKTGGSDSPSPEKLEKVLNFSGTIENKDDSVTQKTVSSFSNKMKALGDLKSHKPDILSKSRKDNKARTEDSRFKVISCLRAISETYEEGEESKKDDKLKSIAIVDVDVEKVSESSSDEKSNEDAYVYDLYSANFEDLCDLNLDNLIGIQRYESKPFDLQYRNPEDYTDEDFDPEEDDSNDENNWRNDYPDSDFSVDEDEMRIAAQMRGFGLDDGYDLSSDDEEESFTNYSNTERRSTYLKAADIGGTAFARYKLKLLDGTFDDKYIIEDVEDEEAF